MVTRSGRKAVLSASLLASVVAAVAMAATPAPPASAPAVDQNGPSMKDVYKGHFLIGTAADVPSGFSQQDLQVILDNFNVLTPENAMKPGPIHPSEAQYNFTRTDALVDWCVKNNIKIHGHCLAWHSQTTNWMFQGADKDTVIKRLQDHIKTVVGRYKGKILSWDVINESINDGGNAQTTQTENLRTSSPYVRSIGPEFFEIAFNAAHEADPDAHLYYNDYNIENGFKHGSSMVLLKRLLDHKVPIYGVGIQGHWSTGGAPLAECDRSIGDYASLGLHVSVSELDITTTGVQGGQLNPAGGGAPAGGRRGAAGAFLVDDQGFYYVAAPGGAGGARGAGRGAFGGAGGAPNLLASIQTAVTDLTDDQRTRLTAANDALTAKLNDWQTSSQEALQPLAPAIGQPADPAAQDKYNAEFYKQNLLREDLLNDAELAMLAILSPAQAQKWESARLNAQLTAELGTLGWSVAQKSQVDPLLADTSRKLAAAKDKPALVNARSEFWNKVAGLLNDVQITQVFAPTFAAGRGGMGGMGGMGGALGGGMGGGMGGGGMGGRGGGGGASPAALAAQAQTYAKAFAIFEKHKDVIERVTFWGLNDRRSWRAGSNPLILDSNNLRKPCYISIVNVILKPDPTLWPN